MSARRSSACDPIHHAGYLTCPICEAPAWASEATWLDNDSILAIYVPTCSHAAEQVSVVDGGGHQ